MSSPLHVNLVYIVYRCVVFIAFVVLVTMIDVAVIQSLGEQIKVRQQVIATATIYFKRFYARYALQVILSPLTQLQLLNSEILCCLLSRYLLDR